MTRLCVVLLLTPLLILSSVFAGANDNAKIAAHLIPITSKSSLTSSAPAPPCNRGENHLLVNGQIGVPYYLYLLVMDADSDQGIGGATFSIDYSGAGTGDGLRIFNWESAAGMQLKGSDWPLPGSSITVAFGGGDDAVRTAAGNDGDGRVTAVLGRFYVYAYGADVFEIIPNPEPEGGSEEPSEWQSAIRISGGNEESALVYPDHVGRVAFGGSGAGYDPCLNAIEETQNKNPSLELSGDTRLTVSQGRPNPFQGRIQWTLGSREGRTVSISVFSVTGRRIRAWPSEILPAGETAVFWDGKDQTGRTVSGGSYYLEVKGEDGYRLVRKAVLLQ